MSWIIGLSVYVLIVAFAWSLCAIAGRADEQAERMSKK